MWKSPNGTIRGILQGTVFREPIILDTVPRLVPGWIKPIVIGRHAFGDQYQATDLVMNPGQSAELVIKSKTEKEVSRHQLCSFDDTESATPAGCIMGMFNKTKSIEAFAHACFSYALNRNMPLYLSTKNTILKQYDGLFRDTFARIYDDKYKDTFKKQGLSYEHR